MSEKDQFRFKMILFGNIQVGKTSLVVRYVSDKFDEGSLSTLGYDVYQKNVEDVHADIGLVIFDIGGQEKFEELRKEYGRGANTAFLVYDITNEASFKNLIKWKEDLDRFAGKVPFIIVGNKLDLESERQVSTSEAKALAEQLGAVMFFETSAKTGDGVEDAFRTLAFKTYKLIKQ